MGAGVVDYIILNKKLLLQLLCQYFIINNGLYN